MAMYFDLSRQGCGVSRMLLADKSQALQRAVIPKKVHSSSFMGLFREGVQV